MKATVTIVLLFLSTLTFAQHSKQKSYRNVIGLELPDTILYKNIIGSFTMGDNFESHGYHFDSTMKFKEIFSSDVEYYKVLDSGTWTIKNRKLILKSSTKKTKLDIVKFDKYYFFVSPEQRNEFLKEYKHIMDSYKGGESIKIDEKTTATQQLAAWQLSKMFYSRRLDDITGT